MGTYLNVLLFAVLAWFTIASIVRLSRYRTLRNAGMLAIMAIFLTASTVNLFMPGKIPATLGGLLKFIPGGYTIRATVLIIIAVILTVTVLVYLYAPELRRVAARRRAKGK